LGENIKFVIFADLDGTLLDAYTFQPGPSVASLDGCKRQNIPVVFVSSKTRAEIEKIRRELNNTHPFVSENGGGIFLPRVNWPKPENAIESGDYWCITKATPHSSIVNILRQVARNIGADIIGFEDLPERDISKATGMAAEDAKLAKERAFDEPFMILNETEELVQRLRDEMSVHGLNHTKGGIFHHIMGHYDKGWAVCQLKEIYRRINPQLKFVAIGDASNDIPMLREVDYPFLVRKPDGSYETKASFPGITITDGAGPEGFSEAIASLF